jgi:hypothetical protein
MGMMWLLAVLGAIGVSPSRAEPPLPLSLAVTLFEPEPSILPEFDPHWPVYWLDSRLENRDARDPAVFHWPDDARAQELNRLPAPAGESSDLYYVSRIELGLARIRQTEAEPRLFPALCRGVLGLPLGLIEAVTDAVAPSVVIVNGRQVFNQVEPTEDLATIAGRTLLKAEMNFLASLPTSYIYTAGVQNGTEDFDRSRLFRLQWRALFNGMKNGYRERYEIPSLDIDTVLGAVSSGDWVDFIIIPAAVSIYAARFGIDRKLRLGDDVRIDLQIEKATRFQKVLTSDHGGRLVSASFNFFKLPASIVVSLDADPHGLGIGFLGIGTDINTALCAITNNEEADRRR